HLELLEPYATIEKILLEHSADLVASVWPDPSGPHGSEVDNDLAIRLRTPYPFEERGPVADWLAKQLLEGIPGREHCDLEGERHIVWDADVINGVWLARQRIAEHRAELAAGREPTVDGVPVFDVPVERLADKAIDTLEFLRHWRKSDGKDAKLTDASGGPAAGTLSEPEINRRLIEGSLVITPLLPDAVQEAGIDVRLSNRFIIFQRSAVRAFDALFSSDPRSIQSVGEKRWGDTFVLHPNETVLAATLEYLVMPGDLTAQVATRSSYGRLGLITATAVQVNPHFRGCLTLELVNLGGTPLVLTPGERIAQVIISTLSHGVPPRPPRKYEYPTGPQFSRVANDPEAAVLRSMREAAGTAPRSPS
ncbi:MAG: dCTP deaminase, partial [Frankiaceae bacterium]|nr:dCTP deaminase [Frankiaceae bacterium]